MKTSMAFIILIIFSFQSLSQDYAKKQLDNSPRHHEWVRIESNNRDLHCFVAYPEVSEKVITVIVIHENRGLDDWARSMADQLAAEGYLAIAPDLLSGASEEYEKTMDYPTSDDARSAIYSLDQDKITQDLQKVYNYASSNRASNGKIAVMGFCWGGSQTFRYATINPKIDAALVFYGTAPSEKSELKSIEAPVYGFYGGNDARVNATIGATDSAMQAYDNSYEYEIYEGAGHAFMRRGDDPNGDQPNVDARNAAWRRINAILDKL